MRAEPAIFCAVFVERILERVGLHQQVDRPSRRSRIFCSNSSRKPLIASGFAFHEELDHFLEENALEFFEPARLEGAAFDDDFAVAGEERVVLRFVAEHGVELFVELDLDAGRQFFRQLRHARSCFGFGVRSGGTK